MNKLYEENAVQDIANAIREKNGLATLYKIDEMGQAIREIKTGASGLNVVRSATKPASAPENTVWLETDIQNGALFVSSVEPASPVDGDVWIVPNNARPLEFPVFEGVNISMGVARLRAAGAWSFIDFAGYVNGVWKDSHTPLFKDGAWGGVLPQGNVLSSAWANAGSGIPASINIANNLLVFSGYSYAITKGSGFTGVGTNKYIPMSNYFWQRATFKTNNISDGYFGLYWEDRTNGGTYELQGTHILPQETTDFTTYTREIDYTNTAYPAIMVRDTTGTRILMTITVSDWFIV